MEDKVDDLKGKAKEALADRTGDPDLKAEGQRDQAGAKVKHAAEKAEDATEDVVDKVKGIFKH